MAVRSVSSNQPDKDTGKQSIVTSTPKRARPDSQLSTIDDLKGKMDHIQPALWVDGSVVYTKKICTVYLGILLLYYSEL